MNRRAILCCLVVLHAVCRAASQAQPPGSILSSLRESEEPRARVVIVSDPKATELLKPSPGPIRAMVESGLTNLTGQPNQAAAWRGLLSTQETVGIKVFTHPGAYAGTRLPVTAAVVEGLLQAGLPPRQIVVWDKQLTSLRDAGYLALVTNYQVRVEGAADAGYDDQVSYENALLGKLVYGDHEFGRTEEGIGRKSFASKLLTREVKKLIVISPMLNHNAAGVCGSLYSLALGGVDNTIRFDLSPATLAVAVPEIWVREGFDLVDRVVLNIVDGLFCQYQGQDNAMLHYTTVLNELRFSRDPVALDYLSLQELQGQRQKAGVRAGYLNRDLYENAGLLELGIQNLSRIFVERVP